MKKKTEPPIVELPEQSYQPSVAELREPQISLHRLFYVGMIVGGDAGSGWVGATIEVRGLSGRIS